MILQLTQTAEMQRVSPQDILDYKTFARKHQTPAGKNEVHGWFGDTFQETFRETLGLIELLGNETRMRMLAPLLERSGAKRDYRTRINPKLVYHNISALSDAGLLDENIEGAYELSQFGRTILAEFITFLEKTRKTLDESRAREVKND